MPINTPALKTEALCWLRFGKKLELVATEAGRWNADVLGCNDNFSVEVEVKVDIRDLRREFTGKSAKHYLYANAEGAPSAGVPNYFYFFVPAALEKEALLLIEEHAPKAGLAVYEDPERKSAMSDGRMTRVARKARRLHDQKPSAKMKRTLLLRMGSELCGRYVAFRDFQYRVLEELWNIDNKIADVVKKMVETPDLEEQP